MEIKELLREKMFVEIIAERDAMIMNLFDEKEQLKNTIKQISDKAQEKQDG